MHNYTVIILFLCSFRYDREAEEEPFSPAENELEATSPPRLLLRRSSQAKVLNSIELPANHLSQAATDSLTSARNRKNPQQSFELDRQQRRLSMLQLQKKHIAESHRRKAMNKAPVYKDKFVSGCGKLVPLSCQPIIKTSPTLPSRITPRDRLLHGRVPNHNSLPPQPTPCSSQVYTLLGLPEIKDPMSKPEQKRKPLPPIKNKHAHGM